MCGNLVVGVVPLLNKSFVTNFICFLVIVIGYFSGEPVRSHILAMGLFGFSGAITNWLAVHMLFEKVPGLYGSGIIPLKFEAFKKAIRHMIMEQFFTAENIRKFTESSDGFKPNLAPILEYIDYDSIFDGFLEVVQNSKYGGMLGMVGGTKALEPMREPFEKKLRSKFLELTTDPKILSKLTHDASSGLDHALQDKIGSMVDHRLAELTPQMVKEIIQEMIRSHLGWLVVWGGVFGSAIGLISSFLTVMQ